MEANICSNCYSEEFDVTNMRACVDWSNKCVKCGGTAVFFARKDELVKILNQ